MRKLLAILMCVCLAMTLLASAAFADAPAAPADPAHTDHAGWTALTSDTTYITVGGSYYLASDLVAIEPIEINGSIEVTLCLNGHTLKKLKSGSAINCQFRCDT